MKKKLMKLAVTATMVLGLGAPLANTALASHKYYDNTTHTYVKVSDEKEKGKDLLSSKGLPGGKYYKMKQAVLKKYGYINRNVKYKFICKKVYNRYGDLISETVECVGIKH